MTEASAREDERPAATPQTRRSKQGCDAPKTSLASRFVSAPGGFAAILVPCWVWTLAAGKDLNFDLLNYHVYAGFAANSDRLSQDFFPASIQSYLSPYALLPLHWLLTLKVPAVLAGCALATIQAINLWLALVLARRLMPGSDRPSRLWQMAAVLMAGLSPLFLLELGTSFYDSIASIPVVAAFAIVADDSRGAPRRALLAGLVMGAGIGLKLTNLVFAAGLGLGLVFAVRPLRSLLQAAPLYAAGGMAGLGMTAGYWMWRLWITFGNPVFPFFNGIFGSPDYFTHNHVHERFRRAIFDQLLLPFEMADPRANIYTETAAPDIRFGTLLLVALVAIALSLAKRWGRSRAIQSDPASQRPTLTMGQMWLLSATAASFILWSERSGNGRYLMPLFLIIGPVLVWAIRSTIPYGKPRTVVLATVFAVQGLGIALGTDSRWTQARWDQQWLEIEGTEFLKLEPRLYLSVSTQSTSFLAPLAHRDSSFVNVVGQHNLSLEGPGGNRLRGLLRRYEGHISIVFPFDGPASRHPLTRSVWEAMVSRTKHLGLAGERPDCRFLLVRGARPPDRFVPFDVKDPDSKQQLDLAVCPLVRSAPDPSFERERLRASALLDGIEAACPDAFRPRGVPVIRNGPLWSRFYAETDRLLSWNGKRFEVDSYLTPVLVWAAKSDGLPDKPPAGCPPSGWTRPPRTAASGRD